MRTLVDLFVRVGAIAAFVLAAGGTGLYACFIALSFRESSYAFYPASIVACYLVQVRFIFCSSAASAVAAWLASIATCGVAAAGGVYGFVDMTEGEPGPWDWLNGQSLPGAVLVASLVALQTLRRGPNQAHPLDGGKPRRLQIERHWPATSDARRSVKA
jgi:hypothetical protein